MYWKTKINGSCMVLSLRCSYLHVWYNMASHLAAFIARVPISLRPLSCALSRFVQRLGLPLFQGDVILWFVKCAFIKSVPMMCSIGGSGV